MDENFQVPIILGRAFLATTGVVIDVQPGTMSLQLCGEMVDLYFPPLTPCSVSAMLPFHAAPVDFVPLLLCFYGDGDPPMSFIAFSNLSSPIPASLSGTSAYTREVVDTTVVLHG